MFAATRVLKIRKSKSACEFPSLPNMSRTPSPLAPAAIAALSARSGAPPCFLALLEERTDLLSACLTVRVARNSLMLVCAHVHRSHWSVDDAPTTTLAEPRCFLFNATSTLSTLHSALVIACGNTPSARRMHVYSAPPVAQMPVCMDDERALTWSVLSHTVMRNGRLSAALGDMPSSPPQSVGVCASVLSAELNVWGAVPALVRKLWLDSTPGVRLEHIDALRWLLSDLGGGGGTAACRDPLALGTASSSCNCFMNRVFASAGAGCITLHCTLPPKVHMAGVAAAAHGDEQMTYAQFVDELQCQRGLALAHRQMDQRLRQLARTAASLAASSSSDDGSSSSASSSSSYASSCSGSAVVRQSCHSAVLALFHQCPDGARAVLTERACDADAYYGPALRHMLERGGRVSASLLRVSSHSTYALAYQLRDASPWLFVVRVLEATQQEERDFARIGSHVALLLLLHERVRAHTHAHEARSACVLQQVACDGGGGAFYESLSASKNAGSMMLTRAMT